MKKLLLLAFLLFPAQAYAQNWSIFFQASFSTAQNAELRRSFTVASRFGTPRYATASLPTCGATNEGAIATDSTLHTFQYCNGTAWVSGGFGGGTVSGATNFSSAVGFADGTVTAPSIAWTSDQDGTGTGLYRPAANEIAFAINGALRYHFQNGASLFSNGSFVINSTGASLWNSGSLGFASASSVTLSSTPDAFFNRNGAAASIQMGADANGAAVAQTFSSCDGITGTDIAGCNLSLAAGRGTGAGTSGNLVLQASSALATGTTTQARHDRDYIVGKAKDLTESAATTFVQISVASGAFTGGQVDYTVVASDATDHQARSGSIYWAAVNKAGTETCPTPTEIGTSLVAVSAGTLTVSWTADTTPANACNLQANAVSSLTQTTLQLYYRVRINGPGTVTPQ